MKNLLFKLKDKYINELEMVCKNLHENTCSNAAKNGQLDFLKYLHEIGCKWDEDTCFYASKNGYLECLKYAHKNRCPWDV